MHADNSGRALTKWTSNIHNRRTQQTANVMHECTREKRIDSANRMDVKERTNFMHGFQIKMILHNAYVLGCRHKFSFSTSFDFFDGTKTAHSHILSRLFAKSNDILLYSNCISCLSAAAGEWMSVFLVFYKTSDTYRPFSDRALVYSDGFHIL